MTKQINIPEIDRYSYRRTLEEKIADLDARLKIATSRQEYAENLLEVIFDNVREDKECYLEYRDRTKIWITRDKSRDES